VGGARGVHDTQLALRVCAPVFVTVRSCFSTRVRQVFADDYERVKVGESAKGNRMATRR
jgi:hypothetical protein